MALQYWSDDYFKRKPKRSMLLIKLDKEASPDTGSCSSCGETVQFGKMAEHTCPDEKGKE